MRQELSAKRQRRSPDPRSGASGDSVRIWLSETVLGQIASA